MWLRETGARCILSPEEALPRLCGRGSADRRTACVERGRGNSQPLRIQIRNQTPSLLLAPRRSSRLPLAHVMLAHVPSDASLQLMPAEHAPIHSVVLVPGVFLPHAFFCLPPPSTCCPWSSSLWPRSVVKVASALLSHALLLVDVTDVRVPTCAALSWFLWTSTCSSHDGHCVQMCLACVLVCSPTYHAEFRMPYATQ